MDVSKLNKHAYLLRWSGEGRFNLRFISDFHKHLDTILLDPDARMLITTGTGKIYSNGLDLAAITTDPALPPHHFLTFHYFPLLSRLLTLPLLTVAAVQGHAFAGGMVLALAHDHVVMRRDKGFLCMNEVLLPSTVPPGMAEIVMGRVRGFADRRDCLLGAKRFGAEEALQKGFIDAAAGEQELIKKSVEILTAAGSPVLNRAVYSSIKEKLHAKALAALKIPEPAETFKPLLQSKM
jgi:enoyl-CoA hydratase/carnithine racemase